MRNIITVDDKIVWLLAEGGETIGLLEAVTAFDN